MDAQPGRLDLGETPHALTVGTLYRQVTAAVRAAFPTSHLVWVRGEIQSISDRTGHCYIDLVDPDTARGRDTPVLRVNCWGRTWNPLKQSLAQQGIVLEPGTVVTLRGRVEFYPPKGQVNFIATDIDVTALLGRMAARRAALLRALEEEGLLGRNKGLGVPAVPLRIALVASRGTEGYHDFVGQLQHSGLAFEVVLFAANVQGAGAPASVTRALRSVGESDCALAVLVRGGGSRADLAAFDADAVARAITALPMPLWTGIGHTGDQSVADIVAHRAFPTPTACGQELVRQVAAWWADALDRGARVARGAVEVLAGAAGRDRTARLRLGAATRHQLARHGQHLERAVAQIGGQARRQLQFVGDDLARHQRRIGAGAHGVVDRAGDRTATWRRLLAAYDVDRQLERGYTITMDGQGAVVRSVAAVDAGATLVTRFADGRARSVVEDTARRPGGGGAP